MKRATWITSIVATSAALVLTQGCFSRKEKIVYQPAPATEPEVVATEAPPANMVETIPPQPDPAYVWIGGTWIWSGGRWNWEAGRWERPPHPGAVWVANRYVYRHGHHVWVRGGWQ